MHPPQDSRLESVSMHSKGELEKEAELEMAQLLYPVGHRLGKLRRATGTLDTQEVPLLGEPVI